MKLVLSYSSPCTQGYDLSPHASAAQANHALTLRLISAIHSKKG